MTNEEKIDVAFNRALDKCNNTPCMTCKHFRFDNRECFGHIYKEELKQIFNEKK